TREDCADALVDRVLPLIERLFRALHDLAQAPLRFVAIGWGCRGRRGGRLRASLLLVLSRAVRTPRNEAPDGAPAELRQEPPPTLVDEVAEGAERDGPRLRFQILGDDQRKRDLRLVLLRRVVDDLDLFARPDHLADLLEGDVPAVLGIVELTVGVALDNATR